MELSKNSQFWCCEANTANLDRFVLEKILPSIEPRFLSSYPLAEISLMCLVVGRVRPTHIFEWGTNKGRSGSLFHRITEALGLDTVIHSYDLPEYAHRSPAAREDHGKYAQGLSRVHLHLEDGLPGALKQYASERSKDRNLRPLFFVDGDHAYSAVIREVSGLIPVEEEFHILAHDTFVQKPDGKGQSRECWQGCPTALAAFASDYRWLNVGFGTPGMAYLWGRGKRGGNARLRLKWFGIVDRLETRLEKIVHRGIRILRKL